MDQDQVGAALHLVHPTPTEKQRLTTNKIERSKDRKIYSNGIEIDEVKRTQQVMDIPAELQQVMDIPAEPRGKTNGPRHGAGKL